MKRVSVYIDGFNLYHAIDDLKKPWLKWLDLNALALSLLRSGEVLASVHYFSAYATWMPESYARHREYVRALRTKGVIAHMGKFKHKPVVCRECSYQWMKPEEKETDVNIAIGILEGAFTKAYDRCILISADSDLAPAIRMAQRYQPDKEFFVVAPPKRYGSARDLSPKLEITSGRLAKCLFDVHIRDSRGQIIASRPESYSTP